MLLSILDMRLRRTATFPLSRKSRQSPLYLLTTTLRFNDIADLVFRVQKRESILFKKWSKLWKTRGNEAKGAKGTNGGGEKVAAAKHSEPEKVFTCIYVARLNGFTYSAHHTCTVDIRKRIPLKLRNAYR